MPGIGITPVKKTPKPVIKKRSDERKAEAAREAQESKSVWRKVKDFFRWS